MLLRESQVQPLLVVFEDLHWLDGGTQALLDSLIESLPTARFLLLVNYRPEYQHGWGSKTYYTQLRLDPLPPASANELLQALLGDDPSLQPLKQLLIERTEGNPLFLEESVRTLVETQVLVGEAGAYRLAHELPAMQVPAMVQAVLAARQELALQIALGTPLMAARGYAALEVEQAFVRAHELCQHLGEPRQLASVLQRGWTMYLNRGGLHMAHGLAEQLLALAHDRHDLTLRIRAHEALAVTLFHSGIYTQSREHLEQAIALYDPQQHRSRRGLQDPKVTCLSYLATTLWYVGYPDQARQMSHEALTLARELAHPNTLAAALEYAAWLHMLLREAPAVQERDEAVMEFCTEHGLPLMLALATMRRGWAVAIQGRGAEGMAQIQQGLAAWQAQEARLARPVVLGWLAEAYGHMGQAEAGLDVLAEALAIVDKTGERGADELYRLKGELLLHAERGVRNAASTSEECFRQALDIARRQQAKSPELRAAMSLSRLWRKQGKRAEAHQLLAEIYGWFSEGFDTADLQDAKALLEALG